MNKRKIDITEYANQITAALPKGILLTSKADKVNSMVIGWGLLGTNWAKPVFTVFVREGRYTREQLDKNPEFTINVPVGDFDKRILAICGGQSGRNIDKIKEAGMTLVESDTVSVPAIKELPLTLECKVMYRQKQELSLLSDEINRTLYPKDIDGTAVGANRDAHITYFGEIVDAYIIEG